MINGEKIYVMPVGKGFINVNGGYVSLELSRECFINEDQLKTMLDRYGLPVYEFTLGKEIKPEDDLKTEKFEQFFGEPELAKKYDLGHFVSLQNWSVAGGGSWKTTDNQHVFRGDLLSKDSNGKTIVYRKVTKKEEK